MAAFLENTIMRIRHFHFWQDRFRAESMISSALWHQVQSMACHAIVDTTLVCSRNIDRASQVGEFAVDRMLGES